MGRFFGLGLWASRTVVLGSLFVAARAQAQMQPAPVFVRVHAAGAAFTVYAPQLRRHDPPQVVAECADACSFWAWPGDLRVKLTYGDASTNTTLRVRGPASYDFSRPDAALRNLGMTLGIAGPVALLVGSVMVIFSGNECCDEDPASRKTPSVVYYGLGTMAVGAGMTIAGWLLWAQNRAHFQRTNLPAADSETARLGLIPVPAGLGFGATASF